MTDNNNSGSCEDDDTILSINVRCSDYRTANFQVPRSLRIDEFQNILADQLGIPRESQLLIYRGQALNRHGARRIGAFIRESGHTVHVTARQPPPVTTPNQGARVGGAYFSGGNVGVPMMWGYLDGLQPTGAGDPRSPVEPHLSNLVRQLGSAFSMTVNAFQQPPGNNVPTGNVPPYNPPSADVPRPPPVPRPEQPYQPSPPAGVPQAAPATTSPTQPTSTQPAGSQPQVRSFVFQSVGGPPIVSTTSSGGQAADGCRQPDGGQMSNGAESGNMAFGTPQPQDAEMSVTEPSRDTGYALGPRQLHGMATRLFSPMAPFRPFPNDSQSQGQPPDQSHTRSETHTRSQTQQSQSQTGGVGSGPPPQTQSTSQQGSTQSSSFQSQSTTVDSSGAPISTSCTYDVTGVPGQIRITTTVGEPNVSTTTTTTAPPTQTTTHDNSEGQPSATTAQTAPQPESAPPPRAPNPVDVHFDPRPLLREIRRMVMSPRGNGGPSQPQPQPQFRRGGTDNIFIDLLSQATQGFQQQPAGAAQTTQTSYSGSQNCVSDFLTESDRRRQRNTSDWTARVNDADARAVVQEFAQLVEHRPSCRCTVHGRVGGATPSESSNAYDDTSHSANLQEYLQRLASMAETTGNTIQRIGERIISRPETGESLGTALPTTPVDAIGRENWPHIIGTRPAFAPWYHEIYNALPWDLLIRLRTMLEAETGLRIPVVVHAAASEDPRSGPLSRFLILYQQAQAILNVVLSELLAWQNGITRTIHAGRLGRLAEVAFTNARILSELGGIFVAILTYVARHENPAVLARDMGWGQLGSEGARESPRPTTEQGADSGLPHTSDQSPREERHKGGDPQGSMPHSGEVRSVDEAMPSASEGRTAASSSAVDTETVDANALAGQSKRKRVNENNSTPSHTLPPHSSPPNGRSGSDEFADASSSTTIRAEAPAYRGTPGLDTMPSEVQDAWREWTNDPQEFSRTVMKHARISPHSTPYASGNPTLESSAIERQTPPPSASSIFALNWHRALNRSGVNGSAVAPSHLTMPYALSVARTIAEQSQRNSDFLQDTSRFPNVNRILEMLRRAEE